MSTVTQVQEQIAVEGYLTSDDLEAFVARTFGEEPVDGRRVLCIIPDYTRSMPMPVMFRAICDHVGAKAAQLDFLIALATHPPMTDEQIETLLGITAEERATTFKDIGIFNHEWDNPDALTQIGTITEDQFAEISNGMLREAVPVHINKRVLDSDFVCIVGPVFPHEVVGFSGGNKYFFPGVSGPEFLHTFHWLGALVTNPVINGSKNTPVREVVDIAAAMIPVEKRAFCLNQLGKAGSKAIYYGAPEAAWSVAADLAAETHVLYKDKPFKSVLAMSPPMYNEIWTAGKCMYKLEPVVADGGELIIYAPDLTEVSITHGDLIKRVGYHTRDYFLAQMEKFTDIPGGILAHSTHVRGIGTFEDGEEKCRVQVTLATGIPEEECRAINLGYRDPATINPEDWRDREDEGLLLVENAGETLFRLKEGNPVPKEFTTETQRHGED